MPKLASGLNDVRVRNAKPKNKPYKLADGKGLVLLINSNGSKWWRLRYTVDGREKMLSLGVYPEVSLASARNKTHDARIAIAKGNDPSKERLAEKRSALQLHAALSNQLPKTFPPSSPRENLPSLPG